jgi:hypothetical protein
MVTLTCLSVTLYVHCLIIIIIIIIVVDDGFILIIKLTVGALTRLCLVITDMMLTARFSPSCFLFNLFFFLAPIFL